MSRMVWVTANPRDPATGTVVTERLAGGGEYAPYYRDGQHYRAGVAKEPRFKAELGFDEGGWTGGTVPTTGSLVFWASTAGGRDWLASLFWNRAPITIERQPEGGAATTTLNGTIAGTAVSPEGALIFTIAALSGTIDVPIATARFAGNGGIEGGVEAKGRLKRRSWGRVHNIEGRILDKANNVFEFGDPALPLQAFDVLRDKGREAASPAPALLAWQGTAAATLTALKASVPLQGSGVVAPSIACAKWWTQPAGPLTADLRGEIGAGYVETVPEIAGRVMAAVNGPGIANAGTMAALRAGAAGIHIGDENETAAQALDRLFLGSSLNWVLEPAGTIRIREWSFAGPIETLESRSVTRLRTFAPTKTRRVGFRKSYRVHSDGEIAAVLQQTDPDAAALLAALAGDVSTLEATLDGKVTAFFQAATPAAEGAGDLWFRTDTSKWYRSTAAGAASWALTEDAGIGQAIGAAAGAQATADGKVTTYNQQAQPGSPAIGDLWVQPSAVPKVLKRWNGTSWATIANEVTKGSDIGVEDGADVTAYPSGPQVLTVYCDASGTPLPDELPLNASYQYIRGGVATAAAWAKTAPVGLTCTIGGTTTGALQITALPDAASSTLQITANGKPIDVTVNKSVAPTPTGGTGGSSSGASAPATGTISGSCSTTTWQDVGSVLLVGTGSTNAVDLKSVMVKLNPSGTGGSGYWTVETRWLRSYDGTNYTVVGGTVSGNTEVTSEGGMTPIRLAASLTNNVTDAPGASTANIRYKLQARVSLGGTRTHSVSSTGNYSASPA